MALLGRRVVVVLVAYLDDSGKDPQNPITTVAGYAAPAHVWERFEREVEPIIQARIGDLPIHATNLYRGEPPYEDWSVLNKQAFVASLCRVLYPFEPLAVSFSVRKASYRVRAIEMIKRGLHKRIVTPYTFCFERIFDWILLDVRVGKIANEEGLALFVEAGNEHNAEAQQSYEYIKEHFGLDQLKSLTFVGKEDCRAIQMADLWAFYTRRHNRKIEVEGVEPPVDPVLQVLRENLRHKSYVATDFGPEINASRFFSGWRPDAERSS